MRQRVERVEELAKDIVAACVDKKKIEMEGCKYLHEDRELHTDVLMILGELQVRLEKELRCNFNLESDVTPSPEDLNEQNAPVGPGVGNQVFDKNAFEGTKDKYIAAVAMLGKLTLNGYKRVTDAVKKQFQIPDSWMPSYYKLTKDRPEMESVTIKPTLETTINHPAPKDHENAEEVMQDLVDVGLGVQDNDIDINDTIWTPTQHALSVPDATIGVTSFIGQDVSMTHCMEQIKLARSTDKIQGARIKGSFEDYVKLMIADHEKKGRKFGSGKIVVFDSYDGAEHSKTDKKKTSVISFSSKMLSQATIRDGNSAGKSFDILTWQQMKCDEKASTMFPICERVFKERREIERTGTHKKLVKDCELCFYSLHDGKMLYLLTQHSLFNRTHKPFLLCSCRRGECYEENHKCVMISKKDYAQWWDRSERRWKKKRNRLKEGERWDKAEHMDWIDEKNNGILHFGIHPEYFNPESVRFDVFHLRCAITRRLMVHVRKFMLKASPGLYSEFSTVLESFWTDYNVLLWNMNKPFTKLKGNEVLLFIRNTKKLLIG